MERLDAGQDPPPGKIPKGFRHSARRCHDEGGLRRVANHDV